MGQSLPLPERIPKPDQKTLSLMNELGIILGEEYEGYLNYKLPDGWRMVDDSYRQDLPEFYIVDNEGLARFAINGAWKGTYDNQLWIAIIDEPYMFKPKNKQALIPSETDTKAVMGKVLEAIDPQHRPPAPASAQRSKDYC